MVPPYKLITLFVCVILAISARAQMKKADAHFNSFHYSEAIPLYLKEIDKNDSNAVAYSRLGDCYRLIGQITKAEPYYERANRLDPDTPENKFYLAEAMLSNGKLEMAMEQYFEYMGLVPDDERCWARLQSIEGRADFTKDPDKFKVHNVTGINSENSDICPVILDKEIIFTSERNQDIIHYEVSKWTGKPYYGIHHTKFVKSDGTLNTYEVAPYPAKFVNFYHVGPASFSKDQNMVFYTMVDHAAELDTSAVFHSGIFYKTKSKKGKWSKKKAFKYNSKSYSVLHPSLSEDGNTLFFVSDMPGGYGGYDLYECKKSGDEWGKPQNLGFAVNTSANEVFPYIRHDGLLFFSSRGHPGIGDLDIFTTFPYLGEWGNVRNLGAPINSPYDDFGISYFQSRREGLITSNRPGGKGSDDIYFFKPGPSNPTPDSLNIMGMVFTGQNEDVPLGGVKLVLKNEQGQTVETVESDIFGNFVFSTLLSEENYLIEIQEADGVLPGQKIILTDRNGNKLYSTVKESGAFRFSLLSTDKKAMKALVVDDGELLFDFKGQLIGENGLPLKGLKMKVTYNGIDYELIGSTDSSGNFSFKQLPFAQNLLVSLDEADGRFAGMKRIYLYDESNRLIKVIELGVEGQALKFDLLASDKRGLMPIYANDLWLKAMNLPTPEGENNMFISEPIYFEYGDDKILQASERILSKVVKVMLANDALNVEVSAHTDSRGSDSYNLALSEKRAVSVADWIIGHGIARSRIYGHGYGESKLANKCADGVECTEEEHAVNRRTEFNIVAR